jgi:quercetin dioxygenase-like cupin family protein
MGDTSPPDDMVDCRGASAALQSIRWYKAGCGNGRVPMKIVTHTDQPRVTWRTGVETRMQVSAGNGADQLCIFEQWVAPAAGAPTHSHPVEEVLTVLGGKAEMWIDDNRTVLTDGQSIIVPASRRHGFRNVGSGTLHVLAVLASSIFEATSDGADAPVRRWLPEPDLLGDHS